MIHVGKMVQQHIKDSPYTMRSLAEEINSDTGSLFKLFNGKIVLTPKLAMKLENVFGEGKAYEWLHYQVDYLLWKVKNEK